MKKALLALFCLAAADASAATAYDALGAIGKQRGEKLLDQVTEVRGINGAPQPREWVISVADKEARSGVREFGVQGAKIGSERTPAGRAASSPLNMNQLNLDSDGASTIAEREAKKAGFAFDYIDYTLRAGTHSGAPVWELRLVDQKNDQTATLIIAADKGTLLNVEGLAGPKNASPARPEPGPNPGRPDDRRTTGGPTKGKSPSPGLQRVGDSLSNFFDRVGRHMERRGRQIGDKVHELFTGEERHTGGPHGSAEAEPPAPPKPQTTPPPSNTYRDRNGTEYYRPRD